MKQLLFLSILSLFLTSCLYKNEKIDHKTIVEKVYPALFEVITPKLEDEQIQYAEELPFDKLPYKERNDHYHSIGTAFLIDNKNLISAAHVFSPEVFSTYKDYYVRSTNGSVHKIKNVYRYDQLRDIIEFDLESYPQKSLPLILNKKPKLSQTVYTVGNAAGEGISTRGGQIAAFTPEEVNGEWDYIRFSSPASPGNSGGPLINTKGEVLGIIVMKNKSENLNYAVPIKEIKESSTHEALFFSRNIRTKLGKHSLTKDLEFKSSLPTTLSKLRDESLDKRNQFYISLRSELLKKHKQDFPPLNSHFLDYLPEQERRYPFLFLNYDYNLMDWHQKSISTKKFVLKNDLTIYSGEIKDFGFLLMIEKGKSSPPDAMTSPEKLSQSISKVMSLNRKVGVEFVSITSLGIPSKTYDWSDHLGRKWSSFEWFRKHNDYFIAAHTTPTPKGLIAIVTEWRNSSYNKAYKQIILEFLDRFIFSYSGSLKEWESFLKRSDLPIFLESISLKKESDTFKVEDKKFYFSLPQKYLNQETFLQVYLGYDLQEKDKLQLKPIKFALQENRFSKNFVTLSLLDPPRKASGDSYKNEWDNISKGSSQWSGQMKWQGFLSKVYQRLSKGSTTTYVSQCQSDKAQLDWSKKLCSLLKRSFKLLPK